MNVPVVERSRAKGWMVMVVMESEKVFEGISWTSERVVSAKEGAEHLERIHWVEAEVPLKRGSPSWATAIAG